MSSEDTKVCPACGTRAKDRWDFCPRCGESLAHVVIDLGPVDEESAAKPPAGDDFAPSLWTTLGSVALLGVAVLLFVVFRGGPGKPADPSLFSLATSKAPPAPPAPPALKAAADAFRKGRMLLEEGKIAEATLLLAEAVEAEPDNALYRFTYGRALWLGGSKDRAVGELNVAAALVPGSALYWTELARAQRDSGSTEDALRSFARAASLAPNDPGLLKDYGTLLAGNDPVRAMTLLRQASLGRQADPGVQQEIAYALERAGDLSGAESSYRRVVDLVPDAPIARSRLAEVLLQGNRSQEAIDLLREGLQRTPDRPLLQRSLGSLLERSGHPAEAATAYREYSRQAPQAPDAKQLEERANALDQRLAASS